VEQVAIEELAENTFGVVARVERGEIIDVTERGRPIARSVPISPPGDRTADTGTVPATRPCTASADEESTGEDVCRATPTASRPARTPPD
jgi:prevent-host-death family protein